jgi:AcrR family transcriptional regulator
MLVHAQSRPESKRPDIRRAALRLFVRRGLRGTTVRDIAADARVAEGTLYRHWRSKRELARDIYRGCAASLADELRRASATRRSARAKLDAAIRALFRSARGDLLLYEALVLPPGPDTHDFVAEGATPADVIAEIVAEGQRRGEFPPFDPRFAGECILGVVQRVAVARRLGVLPRALTHYQQDLAAAVDAMLTPAGVRRRTTA